MTIRLCFTMAAMLLVACGSQEVETPSHSTESPSAAVGAHSEVADTVYTNGKIYTVNEAQPWADAVAIKEGKFLVVGTNAEAEAVSGRNTRVVDLGGRMAMPGLKIGRAHV